MLVIIEVLKPKKWKKSKLGSEIEDHSYSLVSNYYRMREVEGVFEFKPTMKTYYKISEECLRFELHNFLVELTGFGRKLKSRNQFESGEFR